MRRIVIVGLVLLVVGGIALSMLGHRQSSSGDPLVLPARVPSIRVTELATEQKAAGAEPPTFVSTAAASSPAATTGTLRGRLIDAVTRQPVKEFEVRMLRVQRGPQWHEEQPLERAFQSETGRFAWSEIAPDTWRITVSAHGYRQFDLGELQLAAGKKTREIVMPLLRGFTVRGRVFAAGTGAGVPEAWISFRVANAWPHGRENSYAKTKEDGSFVLDGVPGGDVTLIVSASDFAASQLEINVDEKTLPQDISLSRGGTIAGIVTTTAGAPVKGPITLYSSDIAYGNETGASGQFSFDHMAAGHYVLSANTSAGAAKQDIVLAQDERKEDIVLIVGEGRSVRGMARGLPLDVLKRGRISLSSGSTFLTARLDEHGAYAIQGVPPGRARLSIYVGDRHVTQSFDVPVDQDVTQDLIFPTGARLSGRVTQGGKPATPRMVFATPVEKKTDTLYRARTSPDGTYEIEGLPSGDYRVRADEDISRTITIAGDAVLNIDIPSTQLAGRVVEDGGSVPLVGADVYMRGIDTATARVHGYRETNHFGEFSLTGIEPGEIMLIVYMAGYELHQEKFSYSSPLKDKTITLRKSAGVEVRVAPAANQEPVRGFSVGKMIPGNELEVDLWIPLNREGVGSLPTALAGSKLVIRVGDEPIVIDEWDGQSLNLQL
jgi:hypothetical protein